jgi:predicted AlkP superfamily phosphohydrolase/phosphomutase
MTARVLVIGLDACEPTLLDRWSDEGHLGALSKLRRDGVRAELANTMSTLPGAIWPELEMGRSAGRVAHYYHPYQLHTGEATVRPLNADDIETSLYYWTAAARHGCKVCVVDQPQSVLAPGLPGLWQMVEWGNHDRTFATASEPPELLDEVMRDFGAHPIDNCDEYGQDVHSRLRLLADIRRAVAVKTNVLLDLLDRQEWDLFVGSFTEGHCAGHQLWAYLDESSPYRPKDCPAELANGIRETYQLLDSAVDSLVEAAGSAAAVLVVASHGMGPAIGGPKLIHEALFRLGMARGGNARRLIPHAVRARLRRHLPAVTAPLSRATGLDSARTTAVTVDNNRCAAVRLNVAGREPNGHVRPGAEADALLGRLKREFEALRQPGSGEAIVSRVLTADEAFGRTHHPDVPDLLISFRTDLGPLDACESPSVGRITAPAKSAFSTRTGDHTSQSSRLWAVGLGAGAGTAIEGGSVVDLAPTVLALLGVPLPDSLDGTPLLPLPSADMGLPA